MERYLGACRICGEKDLVRSINLYYSGSEGLTVCAICEMNLVDHVRGMVLIAGIARKAGYKACKEVRKAKEEQKEQAEKVVSGHEEREVCICSHGRIDHQYPDSKCRVVGCVCPGFAMPIY